MDCEDSDKVPSGESEQVVKDSTIQVTVDDLQPGLIVVSFSHKTTVYQGVLLQLDRNRGIPCGISFPKSFIQDGPSSEEPPPKEIIAVELSPLNKRQTYFQRDIINDPTSAIVDPNTKFPTLRRNIKPPARYKNSRMNLRVRNRPVLCAKCQTLCEDKGPPPLPNENTDEDAAKRLLAPVPTRRNQSKAMRTEETTTSGALAIDTSTNFNTDYSYSSYGQRGTINNYWRRPNGIDKIEEKWKLGTNVAGSSKSISNSEPRLYIKPVVSSSTHDPVAVPEMLGVGSLLQDSLSHSSVPMWPLMPILSSSLDSAKIASRTKKSKNLKLCISKLAMSKCDQSERRIVSPTVSKETERVTRSAAALIQDNDEEQIDLQIKDCEKSWNSRIRKRSTVPVRFRDDSYLTKNNIFGFKRRRVDEKSDEAEDLPIYNRRIVSNLDTSKSCSGGQNDVEKDEGKNDVSYSDNSVNSSLSTSSTCSGSGSNGHGHAKGEPAKTPVIKITFGSSGNGVVVQIPPKTTQEETNSSCTKAARKAMKKAKKEARRKVSLSREPSPSPKMAFSPHTLQDNLPDSPLPPVLNPEYPLTPLDDESDPMLFDRGPPPVEHMMPLRYIPKRKKKEKKKKRSKVSKENGVSDEGMSGHESQGGFDYNNVMLCESPETRATSSPSFVSSEQSEAWNDLRDNGTPAVNNLSNHTEAHQRLCLSLKRLDENMYCNITCNNSKMTNSINGSNNNEAEETATAAPELFPSDVIEEPYDYPTNGYEEGAAESLDFYCFEATSHTFRKGDIIWGKLPECPWWPGKIENIYSDAEDVRAKITWYKSDVLSYIEFECVTPFAGAFDTMYTKNRIRGDYQEAVRDALLEAHEMSPKYISSE